MDNAKTIIEFQEENSSFLSEIGQYMDIKFAFLNADYKQIIKPCKCRDFLGDMIWSRIHKKSVNIYGMKYSYKTDPYDLSVTRFSLKFPRKDAMDNFIKNFHYLTDKETKYGIQPSVWFHSNLPLTLVIEGSPIWQSNNWKLSLYTYYIKCMGYHEIGSYSGPEARYQAVLSSEKEETLLNNLKGEFNDTISDLNISHNYSGFVSLISNNRYYIHPAKDKIFGNEEAA